MIKLCDRVHMMQTLQFVHNEKQLRIAKETLEIYAPIAYRLGIKKLQRDLEDLAFAYVYPEDFEKVKKIMTLKKDEIEERLDKFQKPLKKELAKTDVTNFRMDFRVKILYSLFKILKKYQGEFRKF